MMLVEIFFLGVRDGKDWLQPIPPQAPNSIEIAMTHFFVLVDHFLATPKTSL